MRQSLIAALDGLEQGDWEAAHRVAAGDMSAHGAWLHAHLHRVEGDPGNAAYWYRRAGRAAFDGPPEAERAELRAVLSG